ncbi:MAG: GIY-YIG nuclease family protein [Anaerolineales bacterium]|nr:GIY-YIG nuclease family protein [Anaerolineales bacterium]
MTNIHNKVLYTGVTNNIQRRLLEHRENKPGRFTTRYRINKLVYFEATEQMTDAIAREKQIKAGSRQDKIKLIESINPEWNDLAIELFA